MPKRINEDMARQLYVQCQRAYDSVKDSSGIIKNGIPAPDYFDDVYNIPAELLFKELYRSRDTSQDIRIDFDYKLLELINKNATFNSNSLLLGAGKNTPLKKFEVFFQIYFRKDPSAPDLFKKQITLGDIKFAWCSERSFSRLVSQFESDENLTEGGSNTLVYDKSNLYKRFRNERFPQLKDESNLHAIKATLRANHIIDATNKAATAFRNFMSCANVAQAFSSQSVSLSTNVPKIKSAVVYTGVFLVKNSADKKIEILRTDSKRHNLPDQSLKLTVYQSKMALFNNLLKTFRDKSSPTAKRVRYVTLEFASAIDTDDPNLRQLGFWRRLEIATRRSSENRKEKDIIKIFQNYHSKAPHWQQQGQLILDMRNIYVHQGVSPNTNKPNDFYLNWSQQYAEAALRVLVYLYNNRSIWKTEDDIDIFFNHYSQSDRALELAGKLLAARNKSRKTA